AAATHAATENIGKDVAEDITETTGPGTRTGTCRAAEAGMTELVVGSTFLVIRQHVVGRGGFLATRPGLGSSGIAIRVILHCQTPIGLLYFVLGSAFRHAQCFVIILLRHIGSNENAGAAHAPPRLDERSGRNARPARIFCRRRRLMRL